MLKIKINDPLLYASFSSFFLTRILPISPNYIFILIGLLLIIFSNKIILSKVSNLEFVSLIIFHYLLFTLLINNNEVNTTISVLLIYLCTFFYFNYSKNRKISNINIYSKIYLYITLIINIIDTAYRFINPKYEIFQNNLNDENINSILFYAYKFNGIIFQDSNSNGILLLTIFYLSPYIFKNSKLIYYKFLIISLIILTFSRSVILALIITELFYFLKKFNIYKKSLLVFSIVIPLIFLVVDYIKKDGSFLTKIDILIRYNKFLNNADIIDKIFGVGIGNSINALGVGAHNLIITYLVELGIIGFILLFLYIFSLYKISYNKKIIISYLITSMSFSLHSIVFLPLTVLLINKNHESEV